MTTINTLNQINMSNAYKRTFGKNMSGRAFEQKQNHAQQMQKYNQDVVNYNTELSKREQQNERITAIQTIALQSEKAKKKEEQKQKLRQLALQSQANPITLMGATGKTLTGLTLAGWFLT